jgi:type IV pilus assembly protein PilE
MNKAHQAQGWTLVELMVTVALIGVLASIAVPAYNGYITTSQIGTARANAEQLALFQEAYFYENDNSYLAGTFDPSSGTDGLTAELNWAPSGDRDIFSYVVTTDTGCTAPCYTITVTMIASPEITTSITRP